MTAAKNLKLTDVMLQTLDNLAAGGVAKVSTGFSYPIWETEPNVNSRGSCPPQATWQSLFECGLLTRTVVAERCNSRGVPVGVDYHLHINDAGRTAITEQRQIKETNKHKTKRYEFSYHNLDIHGQPKSERPTKETIEGRSEKEAHGRLERKLKRTGTRFGKILLVNVYG